MNASIKELTREIIDLTDQLVAKILERNLALARIRVQNIKLDIANGATYKIIKKYKNSEPIIKTIIVKDNIPDNIRSIDAAYMWKPEVLVEDVDGNTHSVTFKKIEKVLELDNNVEYAF